MNLAALHPFWVAPERERDESVFRDDQILFELIPLSLNTEFPANATAIACVWISYCCFNENFVTDSPKRHRIPAISSEKSDVRGTKYDYIVKIDGYKEEGATEEEDIMDDEDDREEDESLESLYDDEEEEYDTEDNDASEGDESYVCTCEEESEEYDSEDNGVSEGDESSESAQDDASEGDEDRSEGDEDTSEGYEDASEGYQDASERCVEDDFSKDILGLPYEITKQIFGLVRSLLTTLLSADHD